MTASTTLARLDGRTKKARLLRQIRAELTAHVGGQPSATQRTLIEQAAQLQLRVAVMDAKFAATGAQTDHNSRTYLAWANSLSRLLRQLGVKARSADAPDLRSYLAARAGSASAPRAA